MKITILQNDIVWADPKANTAKIDAILAAQPKSDVYLLPEMFTTGFATQPENIAEPLETSSLSWMKEKAKALDAAIAGSIAICTEENGQKVYRNRFFFVKPDGDVVFYDKHHLFTYGGEHKRYTRGEERVVVEFRGFRFLLQVCYDLRFPVFSRNKGDYDAALYVASWPETRVEAWKILLRARAIENQCFVVGLNRVGTDPYCKYSGGSAIIDPYGNVIAAPEDNKEMCVTAELDMDMLKQFREKFPVLNDRDV